MSKIKLLPEQKAHADAIDWLTNPGIKNRGRTYLLATMFVAQAIRYPGHEIAIFDHYSRDRKNDFRIIEVIAHIIGEKDINYFTLDKSKMTLKLNPINIEFEIENVVKFKTHVTTEFEFLTNDK